MSLAAADIEAYFAVVNLNLETHLVCDYFIETSVAPRLAAAQFCQVQATEC